jgi:beta-galactosidase
LSDSHEAASIDFDDATWQVVSVPHDWAITGPFDREHDLQITMIVENGEKKPFEHTGRTGALPHPGLGWYRKSFYVPEEWRSKRVFVEFDGVMSHSVVFLNGKEVGGWPYGYSSFSIELTNNITFDAENVLAVMVNNKPGASRWYPGAGIYRFVRLVVTNPSHIVHWGVWVTTPDVTTNRATSTSRPKWPIKQARLRNCRLRQRCMTQMEQRSAEYYRASRPVNWRCSHSRSS